MKKLIEFHYRVDGGEGSSGKETPEGQGIENWDGMTEEQKSKAAWEYGCDHFCAWYTEEIIEDEGE